MRKTKFSEHQIIKILKEVEGGRMVKDVCREHGIPMPRTTIGNRSMVVWKPPTSSD